MSATGLETCLSMAESALHDALDETGHTLNCVCLLCERINEALVSVSMATSEELDDEQSPPPDEDDQ